MGLISRQSATRGAHLLLRLKSCHVNGLQLGATPNAKRNTYFHTIALGRAHRAQTGNTCCATPPAVALGSPRAPPWVARWGVSITVRNATVACKWSYHEH